MKNYVGKGDHLTITAGAAITAGDVIVQGSVIGIAQATVASGEDVVLVRKGIFSVAKVSAQAWTQGAKVYWDSGADNFTTTASGNTLAGFAAKAAANPSDTGKVLLTGQAV